MVGAGPAASAMRFKSETEQPVQELPWSQITDGAAGLARASARKPSLLEVKANAAAENPQYFRKSRRVIVDILVPVLRRGLASWLVEASGLSQLKHWNL